MPVDPARETRPRRDRHPPARLTYDAPGEPQWYHRVTPIVHPVWATQDPYMFLNYNFPQLWNHTVNMYPPIYGHSGLPRLHYIPPPVQWS